MWREGTQCTVAGRGREREGKPGYRVLSEMGGKYQVRVWRDNQCRGNGWGCSDMGRMFLNRAEGVGSESQWLEAWAVISRV